MGGNAEGGNRESRLLTPISVDISDRAGKFQVTDIIGAGSKVTEVTGKSNFSSSAE
jgi:hypothetical protein